MNAVPLHRSLCVGCAHMREVRNTRGSLFLLCRRSKDQPEYPRYPRQPVIECPGFEPAARE